MEEKEQLSLAEQAKNYIDELNQLTYEDYLKKAKKQYAKRTAFYERSEYYDAYLQNAVDEKMIMYEAFFGRGITCNPAALFYYLLDDERFADYTHVWTLEEGAFRSAIIEKYKNHPNVIFVEPFTKEYYKYLSTAKYLINNVTYQAYFIKKEEQVLVHTWHGIPMKTLGYDTPDGNIESANVVRNFLMADYLISPVPYMTEIFRKTYKLEGILPGKIIETGYPRVDGTFHPDPDKLAEELKRYGVSYDPKKKLILYAPTFRGEQYADPDIDIREYNRFIETIGRYVDLNEYQILFKPHQIVYNALVRQGLLQDNFIPAVVDTNLLLSVTDILISDYSSIFFDYLVTDKPILFYITDLENYQKQRGLYMTIEDLPGPVSSDLEQIGKWVGDIDHYKEYFDYQKYQTFKDTFTSNEDGNVSERVVNAVFFGDETHCKGFPSKKKKLLIHQDPYMNNGISSAAKNLINNLDYEKYDVTCFTMGEKDELREYFKTFRPEVRIMTRIGASVANTETWAKVSYCMDHPVTAADDSPLFPAGFFQTEFRRMFGDAKFDYIIYFNGFSCHSANLYAMQKDTKKLIWMHSELMKEYYRQVDGAFRFMVNMNSLMKLYPLYDACVSCSPTTMLLNKQAMEERGIHANWKAVRNLFDIQPVLKGCKEASFADLGDGKKYFVNIDPTSDEISFVPMPEDHCVNFVTMGRLSNEKNQLALVEAFSRLHEEYPNARLYLIGDGELAKDLRTLIRKKKLVGKVIMTGSLHNPFAVMNQCDCFVLPSHYEGMPVVLLEARTLHLSIIVSNFATVADSLFEDGQLVIGTGVDDIYGGLKAFMEGKVPNRYELDADEYNKDGIQEFEACLTEIDRKWEAKS